MLVATARSKLGAVHCDHMYSSASRLPFCMKSMGAALLNLQQLLDMGGKMKRSELHWSRDNQTDVVLESSYNIFRTKCRL